MKKSGVPGIYNMLLCPVCKGKGKDPDCPLDFGVCKECGGFGFLRRESQDEIRGVETREKPE